MVVSDAREINNMKITAKSFPIARRIETESRNGILATLEEQDTERIPPLRLTMTGGIRDGVLQSAEIALYCSETEKLRHINEDHGLHSFTWETRHACPKAYPRSAASKISIAEEAEDNTGQPPGDEAEKGEGDLMPPQGMSKIRKFIVIALITLLVPSICGFVLFSSTRARNFTIAKFNTALLPFLSKLAIKLRPIGNTIHTLTSQSIGRLKSPFRRAKANSYNGHRRI
ncbi:hypothetical protein BJ912DRAFT_495802 [Pholiota molesta]|nr:hypothetical protein BJ912DRAFT_495802 [Pholiota molesta]